MPAAETLVLALLVAVVVQPAAASHRDLQQEAIPAAATAGGLPEVGLQATEVAVAQSSAAAAAAALDGSGTTTSTPPVSAEGPAAAASLAMTPERLAVVAAAAGFYS